jgi:hypothetical protein
MSEPTTVLNFTGLSLPPYSARGLTQTLEPLDQAGSLRRTVNGELIDLSHEQFRKYRSTISGSDQQPPAIDGVWQGLQVVVDCICELAYLAQGGSPQRPQVSGGSRQDGDFVFYRPRLTMRVTSFSVSTDEYGAVTAWSLGLEEI